MKNELINLTCEIQLAPGEKLILPESLLETVGAGRWRITIQPVKAETEEIITRNHETFLKSYSPEDEGN
ncbi:MAG: hypothetical protein F6K24_34385 [Okeania sp. SIO2D1]|uniref:hypothetical protein n=1 Tax=Okeania sp. SIO2C9 TaxID=2607791 RepID=UPI0013B7D52F|nr:hypothetical protein [Okeania sp. SIO2C9]NEQ76603.1 hypothetical protein [Okeania sp. SIO2C9]NES69943.1 hypothetical protein [Okeania sp. SIO2D1]